MEQNKIVYINVSQLSHHPDNPRFAVGDVTELAESLKAKGCLQNLTVVKKGYSGLEYLVVIGNRRLEAAKLAGIKELPCVTSKMSRQECVETMLLENMQRQDLTPWEEARGIQMMLDDFGCTVPEISAKTGLSESTVYRRRKLLDLDEAVMSELDQLVKKGDRQITLDDYLDVAEIEDETDQVKVLKAIGTSNFNFEMQNAKRKQTQQKNLAILKTRLLDAGYVEIGILSNGYTANGYPSLLSDPYSFKLPELPEGTSGAFHYNPGYGYINLYRTLTDEERERQERIKAASNPNTYNTDDESDEERKAEADKKKKELDERLDKLRELSETAFMCRKEFVLNCYPSKDEHIKAIAEAAAVALFSEDFPNEDMLVVLFDISEDDDEDYINDTFNAKVSEKPYHSLLLILFSCYDSLHRSYYNPCAKYTGNEYISALYDLLIKLGYEMSDEEKQLRDGTHPLFMKEAE